MQETSHLPDGFSIRRHAVQQLLRQALDAAPRAVHGLLGGHGRSVEAVLALYDNPSGIEVHKILQAWRARGIRLLATYSSASAQAPDLPAGLLPDEEVTHLNSLPRLCIRTDTRGRIEADLLVTSAGGHGHSCVLEMQEDGGLYPLANKG